MIAKYIFISFILIISPTNLKHLNAQVLINEIQSNNNYTISDIDGDSNDWIEIINKNDYPVNLFQYSLSDTKETEASWEFPSIVLPSKSRMIIWASGKDQIIENEIHTNFRISSNGEIVKLKNRNGEIIDIVEIGYMPSDLSYGRFPDGSNSFNYFDNPTPNKVNKDKGYLGILDEPELSHKSGFYNNPFVLSIVNDISSQTRYTTDGTEPSIHSDLYEKSGILVYDKTNEGTSLSNIPTSSSWKPPLTPISQSFILKTRNFRKGWYPSKAKTSVYFINNNFNFDHKIPVLSIITSPNNLFDESQGIYIHGQSRIPNFMQEGEDWERNAWLTIFNANRELGVEDAIGIRIHGGTSRRLPQKSLRLYWRERYGNERLYYPLFKNYNIENFKRLILRNAGQDDIYTFLRDPLMHKIAEGLDVDIQAYQPSVLYVNGEYWGIHNIRERLDKYYINSHHSVSYDDLDILKHRNMTVIEGDNKEYIELFNFIDNNSLMNEINYNYISSIIDINNYTDYKILETFFYRWDIENIRYWRERKDNSKWRWMLYDLDTGFGGFWSVEKPWDFDMIDYLTENNGPWSTLLGHNQNFPETTLLFRKLLENNTYKEYFIRRYYDLLNSFFLPSRIINIVDDYASILSDEIYKHINRWNRIESYTYWLSEVKKLRDYALKRHETQTLQLLQYSGVDKLIDININTTPEHAGSVKINTITIDNNLPRPNKKIYPWNGNYPSNVPLSLEAKPNKGYDFSHWDINGTEYHGKIINITPITDVSVKAVFLENGEDKYLLEPHIIYNKPYELSEWNANNKPGVFPKNMQFVYMKETEPYINSTIDGIVNGRYDLKTRTRINGLGRNGFSFINTSNLEGNTGYPGLKLGGVLLALNTEYANNVKIQFEAGTVKTNSRIYGWRLQYRIGENGDFKDLADTNGNIVNYISSKYDNDIGYYDGINLPIDALDKPNIQLLWRYFYTGNRINENDGSRSELKLDNIFIYNDKNAINESSFHDEITFTQNFPNPFANYTTIRFSIRSNANIWLDIYNIYGQKVKSIINGTVYKAGSHNYGLRMNNLPSGVYICRIKAKLNDGTTKKASIKITYFR